MRSISGSVSPNARRIQPVSTPVAVVSIARATARSGPPVSIASSQARRTGRARPRLGENGSMTAPPPMVRVADWSRMTMRSPASACSGRSSTTWTRPLSPGAMLPAPSTATRAVECAAARCACTGVQCRTARGSPGSTRRRTSMRSVGACRARSTIQSPRTIAPDSMSRPARLSAQRWPARACPAGRSWAWMPRMRASWPLGVTTRRSPVAATPACTVPVTTSPAPRSMNARSTQRRNRPSAARAARPRARSRNAPARASTPAPDRAETRWTSAPRMPVAERRASIWPLTSSTRAASTLSTLLTTAMHSLTPSRSRIAVCSRVWGITPSSAATTTSARSMDPTPASMLRTNRSCPGTSTKPST